MQARYHRACVVGAMGLLLLAGAGCEKQSVQTGAEGSLIEQPKAKPVSRPADQPARPSGGTEVVAQDLPPQDLGAGGQTEPTVGVPEPAPSAQSATDAAPPAEPDHLSGLEPIQPGRTPSEERVEGGVLVAKADLGDAAQRRAEDLERERRLAALAGLQDVYFPFDSWAISAEGQQALAADAEWLKQNAGTRVVVEGHCDERGTLAYNMVLGEKRANAARNYLLELGVKPDQVAAVSYGKERPVCKEHNEGCYRKNRRAHVAPRVD